MNRKDIPQGFAMALAQNKQALFYFSTLDDREKQEICSRITSLNTKDEMKEFVKTLASKSQMNDTNDTKSYT